EPQLALEITPTEPGSVCDLQLAVTPSEAACFVDTSVQAFNAAPRAALVAGTANARQARARVLRIWAPLLEGRRDRGLEQALERNPGTFGDSANRVSRALELAEHDLVLANQERAEVAHAVSKSKNDARIERTHVVLPHVGPVTLRHVAPGCRIHRHRR